MLVNTFDLYLETVCASNMSNVECKRKSADVCAKPEKVCVIKKTKGEFDMKDFVRPDQASKCTWHKGADSKTSPHSKIRM